MALGAVQVPREDPPEAEEAMQDGAEEAVPERTNPGSPVAPAVASEEAAAARPNPLSRVAREHLYGKGKGEKGEGVDEGLLQDPERVVDESAEGAAAADVDEVAEEARLEVADRRLHRLDRRLWEDEGVDPEAVEKVERLLQRRRLR